MFDSHAKPNLLLIDDSAADRRLSQLLLEEYFQITLASGPKEARQMLTEATNAPDLVLCDYRMPAEDGLQLYESLRGNDLDEATPFVLMTAAGSPAIERQALEGHVSAVFAKPIDPEVVVPHLLRCVDVAREQLRQREEIRKQNDAIHRIEAELQRQAHQLEEQTNDQTIQLSGIDRFQARLDSAIARDQNQSAWSVLMMDVNRFRDLLAGYGHAAGRAILQQINQRLKACSNKDDLIGHVEPDIYLLASRIPQVQTNSKIEDYLLNQARSILSVMAEPLALDSELLQISCCIGVAQSSADANGGQLISNALQALTLAKRNAQIDPICVFRPEQLRKFREEMLLEAQLRHALRRDEISPYFQPQFDLRTGQLSGAEALARWRLPDGSYVPPMRFIPVAENAKLITPLGDSMLRQSAQAMRAWQHLLPKDFRVGVNVSAAQFARPQLRGEMLRLLDLNQVPASRVELELTESIVVEDTDGLAKRMQQLSDDGFSIALDDFGTGYSSLSILRDLPFTRVKIDRSFIRDLPTSPKCAALLDAVTTLGKSFGFDCIAEGIEDIAQQQRSSDLGILHGQGFLYGRAVSAAEFTESFLRNPLHNHMQQAA